MDRAQRAAAERARKAAIREFIKELRAQLLGCKDKQKRLLLGQSIEGYKAQLKPPAK